MQRQFDRADGPTDVGEALRHMLRLPYERQLWAPSLVVIPLRLLRFVPQPRPLLDVCAVIRLAAAAYDSEAESPTVSDDDPVLVAPTERAVLRASPPVVAVEQLRGERVGWLRQPSESAWWRLVLR